MAGLCYTRAEMRIPHINQLKFSSKTIPLVLIVLTVLGYGLMLPQTGFYWDDWPFAWISHFTGPASFIGAFLRVRPFLGPIFYITTSILPESPLAWQIFALIVRFTLGLSAWWTFKNLWPDRPRQALLTTLLFLVYPGYSQHWVAFTHINQEIIPLLFYLLSFGVTGLALHSPERSNFYTLVAVLLTILGVFPTEYLLGMEPVRFLLIFFITGAKFDNIPTHFFRTLKRWIPYLIIWLGNAAWLFWFYRSGLYVNYSVKIKAQRSLIIIAQDLISKMLDALYKAGIYAWGQVLALTAKTISAPSTWLTIGLMLLTGCLLFLYLSRLSLSQSDSSTRTWALQAMLIGTAGIALGRIPSWAAGLPLTLQSSYDRFNISMMLGASLLAAGLIELAFGHNRWRIPVISLIVALGVGQQFYNANIFRRDWARQQEIYWQFAWRIPAIQPGTILMTDQVEVDYETDYSLTAAINWIYAPDFTLPYIPYLVLNTDKRLGTSRLTEMAPGIPVDFAFRPARFSGTTSQVIGFYAPPTGCLRILDSVYGNQSLYEKISERAAAIVPLSDPALILVNADQPLMPVAVFGNEPAHTWCYYYTKAELARQRGDWQSVADLGAQAKQSGYWSADPVEWLPFIEAYARVGQLELSKTLTFQAKQTQPTLQKGLCTLWTRLVNDQQDNIANFAKTIQSKLKCIP